MTSLAGTSHGAKLMLRAMYYNSLVMRERVALEAWDRIQAGAPADGRAASRPPARAGAVRLAESPG